MVPSLTDCYLRLGFQVTESEEGLRIGFKPGMVHAIVKEVRNERPLTRSDAELFYEKFSTLSKGHRNLYFRIVAHGGFLPEALDFELHGLTISDESYIESLLSGRHVELYPHNEAAYRAIMRGFKQHRTVRSCRLPEQVNPICWHAISQIMQRKRYWSLLRTSRFWMRSGKPSDFLFRK